MGTFLIFMTKSYISLKDSDGSYKHHPVSEEIYTYIKQLEYCIRYPGYSGLKDKYPQRFNRRFAKKERENWIKVKK